MTGVIIRFDDNQHVNVWWLDSLQVSRWSQRRFHPVHRLLGANCNEFQPLLGFFLHFHDLVWWQRCRRWPSTRALMLVFLMLLFDAGWAWAVGLAALPTLPIISIFLVNFSFVSTFFFFSLFFSFSLFLWWRIFKCRFYEFISCCWVELNFRAGLPNWFGFPFFPFFFCFFAGLILANYFNGSLANSREAISSVVRLVLNRICIFKLPLRLQIVTRHYRALEWYINQSRYARIRWSVLMTGWRAVVAPLPPPPSSGGGRSFPSFFLPPPSLLAPLIPPCPPPRHWRLEGAICRPWRGWFIDWSNAMLIRVFPSIFELATSEQLEIPFACSFLFSPSLPPPPPQDR